MVINIIVLLFVVLALGCVINIVEGVVKNNKLKISFKEALDLTELPVVTFICNDKKLNFLIDTGANNSILNKPVSDTMKLKCRDIENLETNTAGGNICLNEAVDLTIKLDDNRLYEESFLISNMSDAFDAIKAETGVTIHGILGSNFFSKYKYIIDYESLALYVK